MSERDADLRERLKQLEKQVREQGKELERLRAIAEKKGAATGVAARPKPPKG